MRILSLTHTCMPKQYMTQELITCQKPLLHNLLHFMGSFWNHVAVNNAVNFDTWFSYSRNLTSM
jgi:hypothetical protein